MIDAFLSGMTDKQTVARLIIRTGDRLQKMGLPPADISVIILTMIRDANIEGLDIEISLQILREKLSGK